jgi:hypothetical protein
MKMNFWKTFIITIVLYLVLNTVFTLIAMFTVVGYPATDVWYIVASIFAPITVYPGAAWIDSGIVALMSTVDSLTVWMTFLGLIVPPLVSLIVAAFIGDNQFTGFGAWFVTAFISCCLYAVFLGVGQATSAYLVVAWAGLLADYGTIGGIINIIFAGIVNGFFYGCICALITKKWM